MRKIFIKNIFELPEVFEYLEKRNLVEQYKKAKIFLLLGYGGKLDFKERKPDGSGIWSFRINRQFRAYGRYENGELYIHTIHNHQ